jgi:hypothetical protein
MSMRLLTMPTRLPSWTNCPASLAQWAAPRWSSGTLIL